MAKLATKGCAQGSKCGPLLFLIVINDLLQKLSNERADVFAYADDLLLVLAGENIELLAAEMNLLLSEIVSWGHVNQLSFNPRKTQAMIIKYGTRKFNWPNLVMDGEKIQESTAIKYLGVLILYDILKS